MISLIERVNKLKLTYSKIFRTTFSNAFSCISQHKLNFDLPFCAKSDRDRTDFLFTNLLYHVYSSRCKISADRDFKYTF